MTTDHPHVIGALFIFLVIAGGLGWIPDFIARERRLRALDRKQRDAKNVRNSQQQGG
jgi:hypothetical protein